jgi:hypothetical protein
MGFAPQRLDEWTSAFSARPIVLALAGHRVAVDPEEAQLLLLDLGRLPTARQAAAEETAAAIVGALAASGAVELEDEHRRCLLRAVEGVRSRQALPWGLQRLRDLLLHAPEPVV